MAPYPCRGGGAYDGAIPYAYGGIEPIKAQDPGSASPKGLLTFVQNGDFFVPVLSERGDARAAPLTAGRRRLHGRMPFTEEMSNLEKLMFSHCTGVRETFSSMGILTKYGFAPIRHFPDFIV